LKARGRVVIHPLARLVSRAAERKTTAPKGSSSPNRQEPMDWRTLFLGVLKSTSDSTGWAATGFRWHGEKGRGGTGEDPDRGMMRSRGVQAPEPSGRKMPAVEPRGCESRPPTREPEGLQRPAARKPLALRRLCQGPGPARADRGTQGPVGCGARGRWQRQTAKVKLPPQNMAAWSTCPSSMRGRKQVRLSAPQTPGTLPRRCQKSRPMAL